MNRDRTWKWCALACAAGIGGAAIAVAAARCIAGRDQALVWAAPTDVVSLVSVPGGVAVESLLHGPRARVAGRAAGFAHNAVGAAIAASNLAPRVTAAAGPAVYEATLHEQCHGDVPAALTHLRAGPSPGGPWQRTPVTAMYFRVLAGDPSGHEVLVSLLSETFQTRKVSDLSRIDVMLRWSAGDWRLCVPLLCTTRHAGTAGYTALGRAR